VFPQFNFWRKTYLCARKKGAAPNRNAAPVFDL
jgi:hypothetical protein